MALPPKSGKTVWREEHHRIIDALKEARERAGLSQADVAVKLGREQSYVSKVERGAQGLEVVEFLDFCSAVGVRPSELLVDISC